METEVAQVFETAKSLNHDQIADLAYRLLRVLDVDGHAGDQPSVDAAWDVEVLRRVSDVENGHVQLVSHDETVLMARGIASSQRK